MWFPFNFAKNLKEKFISFCDGYVKALETFNKHFLWCQLSKNVLLSFLLISSVCYQDVLSCSERNEIASSMGRNFNNSRFLYVKFSKTINLCRYIKMSSVFIFEIKGAKNDKIFNFLKGGFSVMCSPVDISFGVFSETYVRLLKCIT